MPWTEADDMILEGGFSAPDDADLRSRFARARAESKDARGMWGHVKDALTEGAFRSGLGFEPVYRAYRSLKYGQSQERINEDERRIFERLEQRRNSRNNTRFADVDTLSPANIGKWAVDLGGNLVGGVDPTYPISWGKNAFQRIAAQAGINFGVDALSQGQEVRRGIKDKYDPRQGALAFGGGVALQGAGEVAARSRLGRQVNRGSKMPGWKEVNDIIVNHLEGGGTLAKPKVSPKGAMGPQQVMMATARKPGFGIRPWDGKSQADLARVGRQYSAAMMNKYDGDVAKVLAAYNAGPGRVDGLVKKYGDDWRSHLPGETKAYVRKGMRKLGHEQQGIAGLERLAEEGRQGTARSQAIGEIQNQDQDFLFNRRLTSDNSEIDALLAEGQDLRDQMSQIGVDLREGRITPEEAEIRNQEMVELSNDRARRIQLYRLKAGLPVNEPELLGNNVSVLTPKRKSESLISSDDFIDPTSEHLTPAERQEMDASAVRPEVRGALSEDIMEGIRNRGIVATTPVNDIDEAFRNLPPERPPLPGEEGFEAGPGPKGGPDPVGPTAISALTDALKRAKKAGPEQRRLYREARAKRFAEGRSRAQYTEGEAGLHAEKGALKGEMDKIDIEPIRDKLTPDEIKEVLEGIKNSKRLTWIESVVTRDAMIGLLDGKLPTKSELELLYRVHPEIVQEVLNKRSLNEKVKDYLMRAFETTRGQMGSGDVSFGGRQGVMMISRPEWWKSELGQFKALSPSQGNEVLNRQTEDIVQHPHYERSKIAGIQHMDVGGHGSREEFAAHSLAESIPILGQIPKASNRAYTYMGNSLRYSVFYDVVDKAQKLGVDIDDPQWLKSLGDYINIFTGRAAFGKGKVGKALEASMPAANLLLFAPRFVISTFQRLNPALWTRAAIADYKSGSPVILKEMLRDTAAYTGMMASVLGLANLAGFEVDWDPRSPTGLKIKRGDQTYDAGGGMVQTVGFLSKMLTGTKVTGKGVEQDLRDAGYGEDTNTDVVKNFVRTKLHPTISYFWNMKEGENVVGEDFDFLNDTAEALAPMYASTVADLLRDMGDEGIDALIPLAFSSAFAFGGGGVNTYKEENIGRKKKAEQAAKKEAKEQAKEFEDFDGGFDEGFNIEEWDF